MKSFHLSDILSVTTGRMLSTGHIDGICDILNYMTKDDLYTHQLPRAMEECGQFLLEQYPQLKEVIVPDKFKDNFDEWIQEQIARYGEYLPVESLPTGKHVHIDPAAEMRILKPDAKIVSVPTKTTSKNNLN